VNVHVGADPDKMVGKIFQNTIDPRLVFLERASARLILFHEGLVTLAEAFDGLVDTLSCPCSRELVKRWEQQDRRRRHARRQHDR
jgi:hypothetical protein